MQKIFNRSSLVTFFLVIFFNIFLYGNDSLLDQSSDENMLFQTEDNISAVEENPTLNVSFNDEKSINFSGQFNCQSFYSINRNWLLNNGGSGNNSFFIYTNGDIFLDIRLKKGIKAFLDLGLTNLSASSQTVRH